jgi:hypothetical protein
MVPALKNKKFYIWRFILFLSIKINNKIINNSSSSLSLFCIRKIIIFISDSLWIMLNFSKNFVTMYERFWALLHEMYSEANLQPIC